MTAHGVAVGEGPGDAEGDSEGEGEGSGSGSVVEEGEGSEPADAEGKVPEPQRPPVDPGDTSRTGNPSACAPTSTGPITVTSSGAGGVDGSGLTEGDGSAVAGVTTTQDVTSQLCGSLVVEHAQAPG